MSAAVASTAAQLPVEVAVELRLRLVEALVAGSTPAPPRQPGQPALARRADDVLKGLRLALEENGSDALKGFVDSYDFNAPLLRPPLPLSAEAQAKALPSNVKAALVLEAEQDIRTLERDLRELETLDKRGIAGAGQLQGVAELQPQLKAVQAELPAIAQSYYDLEDRLTQLLAHYNDYVNSVSALFVSWNATLSEAEESVTRLEKARDA